MFTVAAAVDVLFSVAGKVFLWLAAGLWNQEPREGDDALHGSADSRWLCTPTEVAARGPPAHPASPAAREERGWLPWQRVLGNGEVRAMAWKEETCWLQPRGYYASLICGAVSPNGRRHRRLSVLQRHCHNVCLPWADAWYSRHLYLQWCGEAPAHHTHKTWAGTTPVDSH